MISDAVQASGPRLSTNKVLTIIQDRSGTVCIGASLMRGKYPKGLERLNRHGIYGKSSFRKVRGWRGTIEGGVDDI